MPHKFHIEYFEPKHLKRADEMLTRHLNEVIKEKEHCQDKIKKSLTTPSFWKRLKHTLHLS